MLNVKIFGSEERLSQASGEACVIQVDFHYNKLSGTQRYHQRHLLKSKENHFSNVLWVYTVQGNKTKQGVEKTGGKGTPGSVLLYSSTNLRFPPLDTAVVLSGL